MEKEGFKDHALYVCADPTVQKVNKEIGRLWWGWS
jgi:hypothetical protein